MSTGDDTDDLCLADACCSELTACTDGGAEVDACLECFDAGGGARCDAALTCVDESGC